nr:TAXI family TRAP transporter solute-binding subunit [uncultured Oscillibacter sp.]
MKKSHRILALILTLCFCMSMLTACGDSTTDEQGGGDSDSAKETVGDQVVQLRFATASTGSVDYTIGALLCNLLESYLPAGSKITQETIATGNSTTGYLIEAGACDIARGQNAVAATVGVDGRDPYSNVRALCGLYTENLICQIFTESFVKDTGYTSLRECIENQYPVRIVCEEVGSSDYVVLDYLLECLGSSVEDIESWGGSVTYTGSSTEVEMLQDGQADLMIPHTSVTSSSVSELTLSTDVEIYGLDDDILDFFLTKGFGETVIPAGTFGFFDEDTRSVAMGSSLIVSADMSDEVAYQLTKIISEHAEEDLSADNTTFSNLGYDVLCDSTLCVVPYHPGAIQYFQEVGAMDAEGNYTGG